MGDPWIFPMEHEEKRWSFVAAATTFVTFLPYFFLLFFLSLHLSV